MLYWIDPFGQLASGDTPHPDAVRLDLSNLSGLKDLRMAQLAKYRYGKETGGITVGGATIETSRDSQALITGAYTALKNGMSAQVNYKANGNIWITLTAAQFYPVAEAVFAHVQACFDNEKVHSQAIQALTSATDVLAYDFTTGWPT